MDYAIVIPAYNEEDFLEITLESVVHQNKLPITCVVVDDGSTDSTSDIANEYAENYDFIEVVKHSSHNKAHSPGAKIIRAFYKGFAKVNDDEIDVIVKLDADIALPKNYFERSLKHFERDSDIGLTGGVCYVFENDEWVPEKVSNDDHVRGPIKAYRKECLESIGGIPVHIGWDTLDEYLAKYNGWKVHVDKSLKVKHFRPTGQKNFFSVHYKTGKTLYKMRYRFVLTLLTCFKIGLNRRPYILSGFIAFMGFLFAFIKNEDYFINAEVGEFIRKERWKGVIRKLSNKSNNK